MMVLLFGILVSAACYGTGRRVLRLFNLGCDRLETFSFGTGLGLGILAYGVLILGIFHILTPIALWTLLGVFGIVGFFPSDSVDFSWLHLRHSDPEHNEGEESKSLKSEILRQPRKGAASLKPPQDDANFCFLLTGLVLICLVCAFSGVLAPETANDSLCYHLNLPKQFLWAHQVFALPYDVNAGFPLLMEMLYTLGLGIGGAGLAKFFHFLTGLIPAGCIAAAASRMVPSQYGKWAGLLFLTTPGILNQLGTTYVDVGLACFTDRKSTRLN